MFGKPGVDWWLGLAMWHLWKLVWVAAAPGLPTCHLFVLPASPLACLGPLQRKSWDACPLLPAPPQVSPAPGCGLRTIGGNDSFREALELGQAPEIAGKDLGGQCPCALGSVWGVPLSPGEELHVILCAQMVGSTGQAVGPFPSEFLHQPDF